MYILKLILPNNADTINLKNAVLPAGEYDFSDVKNLKLFNADLSRATKLILPANHHNIDLCNAKLPTQPYSDNIFNKIVQKYKQDKIK